TGITGQDGAYLSRLLLDKGYEVYGAARRTSDANNWRLRYLGIFSQVNLLPFELLEQGNVVNVINKVQPDEVYNLAAQSFVGTSFDQPLYTSDVNYLGVIRILEAIRQTKRDIAFYQASTSEMFGKVKEDPQSETTPFHPRSPYGVAKLAAHWAAVNYREAYGMRCSCGILFNHESPLRGQEFVTRKISIAISRIASGLQDKLELGNLDAMRDWGHAADYVDGMWRMTQRSEGDDFVLGTGETHTVREFVDICAQEFGINLEWSGSGVNEIGKDVKSNKVIVTVNPEFYRPAEVDLLRANPEKAASVLEWKPSISFTELAREMVIADMEICKRH
ncbi:MAG: GDP-mannose 4,6-dehydratase, partial [Pseudomonadota bacterium]